MPRFEGREGEWKPVGSWWCCSTVKWEATAVSLVSRGVCTVYTAYAEENRETGEQEVRTQWPMHLTQWIRLHSLSNVNYHTQGRLVSLASDPKSESKGSSGCRMRDSWDKNLISRVIPLSLFLSTRRETSPASLFLSILFIFMFFVWEKDSNVITTLKEESIFTWEWNKINRSRNLPSCSTRIEKQRDT